LLLPLFGCGDPGGSSPAGADAAVDGFPVRVEAANGSVLVQERPRRIVSLSPTATETLYEIGAGSQVVAVDRASNHPKEAPSTDLSGFDPNVEAIAAYEPDLVVYSTEAGNLEEALDAIGAVALMQPPARDLAGAYDQILQLGNATGHRLRSEELVEEMKADIDEIVEARPRLSARPSYYHELDVTGYTATSGSFIGEIYGLLGLRNIADAANSAAGGYVQLSNEYIIQADPDLIFLADAKCCGQSIDTLAQRPGWAQIKAVRTGRTIELDDDVASRWGPRTVELVRSVAHGVELLGTERSPEP
jgi:iron complex transport system substrate-binding protein